MSLLTPLYAIGLLAISLPILFHLIRRTPRGRVAFSTLMFLSPSNPRVTRRSRVDHWLLLILRGLAIILLAMAFSRPFFRDSAQHLFAQAPGQRVAILIDTSASMRREDLWNQAVERVIATAEQLQPQDSAALFAFDARTLPLLTFSDWEQTTPAERVSVLRDRLANVEPTWRATHLDTALETASAALLRENSRQDAESVHAQRIVLVSDLQRGSRVEELGGDRWPEEIMIELETIAADATTNASLQVVSAPSDEPQSNDNHEIRVRVFNAVDSSRDRFRIAWASEQQTSLAEAEEIRVYVPAGQSRVVKVPLLEGNAQSAYLKLTGDDHDFDNRAYLVVPKREVVTVWYFGGDNVDDAQQPKYFLERALAETALREVNLVTPAVAEEKPQPSSGVTLAVLTEPQPANQLDSLQNLLKNGGTVLFLLPSAQAMQAATELIGCGEVPATEADVDGYAMLGEVRFDHPLFASFAEARYSDFTKIHFWKHRRIDESLLPDSQVLARFDDGSPALVETPVGKGKVLLLTAGWHPEDSQLALSSKFAPLLNAILEHSSRTPSRSPSYHVGESVACTLATVEDHPKYVLSLPGNEVETLSEDDTATAETAVPGIYRFQAGTQSQEFAVNLAPDESQTAPLPAERLEQLGLQLARQLSAKEQQQAEQFQRQLRNRELEENQKIWRWLIVAALALLIAETLLAGRTPARFKTP